MRGSRRKERSRRDDSAGSPLPAPSGCRGSLNITHSSEPATIFNDYTGYRGEGFAAAEGSAMSDPAAVLSYYFPQPAMVRRIEPLANAGGWSGSQIWRIELASGETLCLRRWPSEHPTRERLAFIHAMLNAAAALPFVPVPS